MNWEDSYVPNHPVEYPQEDVLMANWGLETDSDDTMFDESEASFQSMSTIQSDQVADYFLSVHGFQYQFVESVPRIFPADASLDRRDIMLHIILRLARGGTNVPPKVDEMLRSGRLDRNQGATRILEVVTNSGAWTREMADTYPNTTLVSIDTKPLVPHAPHARIKYEVYDLCAGILEPESSFDLVYIKYTLMVTRDFNRLLQDMHRVLKPNGFLLMDVISVRLYEGERLIDPLNSPTPFASDLHFIQTFWEQQGSDISIWDNLASRLDPAHPHWQNCQSLAPNPQSTATYPVRGFHSIDMQTVPIPVGTWSSDEGGRVLGGLMKTYIEVSWRNLLPGMLMNGKREEEARSTILEGLHNLRDIDRFRTNHIGQLWCVQKM